MQSRKTNVMGSDTLEELEELSGADEISGHLVALWYCVTHLDRQGIGSGLREEEKRNHDEIKINT